MKKKSLSKHHPYHPSYYSMSERNIPQIRESWIEVKGNVTVTGNDFLILDFINCLVIGTTDTKVLQDFWILFGHEILGKFKEIAKNMVFKKGNYDSLTSMGKLDMESRDSVTKIQTICRVLDIEVTFSGKRMKVWEMKNKTP